VAGNYGMYLMGMNPRLVFDGGVDEASQRTAHGILDLSSVYTTGCVVFTPDAGFQGLDTFSYHWQYQFFGDPTPRSTNVARAEMQVGSCIGIEAAGAAVWQGNTVVGAGSETQATVMLQNPRGDGAATTVAWTATFDSGAVQIFDADGREILPGQSIETVVPGYTPGGGGRAWFSITIIGDPSAVGATVGIGIGGVTPGYEPPGYPGYPPTVIWPAAGGGGGGYLPLSVVNADIDTDSNNDGTIDPDNSPAGTDDPIEADANKPGRLVGVGDVAEAILRPVTGITPTAADQAFAELDAPAGVNVWLDEAKTTPVISGGGSARWDLYDQSFPSTIWVEGVASGAADLTWSVLVGGQQAARDEISLKVVDVYIKKDGSDVTNKTSTVIVGQRISLEGVCFDDGITSKQWTIPGSDNTRVKDYKLATGTVTTLSNADLKSKDLNFYWIDGGDNLVVTYAVTISGKVFSAKTTFKVLRPSAALAATETTDDPKVHIETPYAPDTYLTFGRSVLNHTERAGVKWSGTVTAPTGGMGKIAFMQLVVPDRDEDFGYGIHATLTSKGAKVADDKEGIPYQKSDSINPGEATVISRNDSPAVLLERTFAAASASDSFETFLMYQPTGTTTIWVTLAKLSWSWQGEADNYSPLGLGWIGGGYDTVGAGANSTELPKWTRAVSTINYVIQ